MVKNSERRNAAACLLLLGVLLSLPFLSGCNEAKAGLVTDADRASAAADLAYVSIMDREKAWNPIDDAKPSPPAPVPVPAPRPFTVQNAVAIDGGQALRMPDPIEISYDRGSCADGSCEHGSGDAYEYSDGDRPRRPVVRVLSAPLRRVAVAVNRARPVRRIVGFLFRRRCG